MKGKIVLGVVFGFLFATSAFSVPMTEIEYAAADLGSGRWQYTYEVTNLSLPSAIEEFTIWFDYELYDNLTVVIPPPAGWEQIVWQPEPVLEDDGGYDALVLDTGIGVGQSVSGFSVSFDWLGIGQPGPQFYEIIDPLTLDTIDSGWTVPEPGTLVLLGLGAMLLRRKKLATMMDDSKASGNQGTR